VNSARVEVEDESTGASRTLKEQTLDPVTALWTPGNHPHAQVGLSVGTQHDFGRIKVTAHVTLECDQKEKTLDEAGMHSFRKAVEYLNDGLSILKADGTLT
jgi:hypothetical protein